MGNAQIKSVRNWDWVIETRRLGNCPWEGILHALKISNCLEIKIVKKIIVYNSLVAATYLKTIRWEFSSFKKIAMSWQVLVVYNSSSTVQQSRKKVNYKMDGHVKKRATITGWWWRKWRPVINTEGPREIHTFCVTCTELPPLCTEELGECMWFNAMLL